MGEARRKQLAGNTEPSNPKWKRTNRATRRDIAELSERIMAELPFVFMNYPQRLAAVAANRKRLEQHEKENNG